MNKSATHPTLIIVRGLPGSGKTYFAEALAKKFGKDELILLDPDIVDQNSSEYKDHVARATAEGVDPKLHLYRYLRSQAYQGIAECKVIMWNQPFTNLEIFNKMMANMNLQAEQNNTALETLVVEVETDPQTAKARVQARKDAGGHGPSGNAFARFTSDYHSFAEHGYKVVSIKGTDTVADSVAAVMAALKK